MKTKKCRICGETKDLINFQVRKSSKDGFRNECKDCAKIIRKEYTKKNKDKKREYDKIYRLENKNKLSDRSKRYYQENKEIIKANVKKYREKNKDKLNKKRNIYRNKRRKEDGIYKLKSNIRCLIKNSLKNQGHLKKTKTNQILGVDVDVFKIHIENQFKEGMTWENYGEWQLDHIIPVSSGKSEKEVIELNHYTNFQPLWKYDNLSKSNKLPKNHQTKLIL